MLTQNRLISPSCIKSLVHKTLKHKQSIPPHQNTTTSTYQLLFNKKKLTKQSKLNKLSKSITIFNQLTNYIKFDEIYKQIIKAISILYFTKKSQQQQQHCRKNTINYQDLFLNKIQTLQLTPYRQILNYLNNRIQSQYGAKFRKMLRQQSTKIHQLLSSLEPPSSSLNFNLLFPQQQQPQLQTNIPYDDEQKYPNLFNKYKIKQKPIKGMHFTERQKKQIEHFCHQALVYLSLAIKHSKRKSSNVTHNLPLNNQVKPENYHQLQIARKSQCIHGRKTQDKLFFERLALSQRNSRLRRTFYRSERKTKHSDSGFLSTLQQNPKKNSSLPSTKLNIKAHKYLKNCHNNSPIKQLIQPKIVSPPDPHPQPSKTHKPSVIVQKRLKKLNTNKLFNSKISIILNDIDRQQFRSKFQKNQIQNYIFQTQKQYSKLKLDDQVIYLIDQIGNQIVQKQNQENMKISCNK